MKNILCPIDFSPAANNAVEYASRFTQHTGARLTLLHIRLAPTVQEVADLHAGFRPSPETLDSELQRKLDTYRKSVEQTFKVQCRSLVESDTSGIHTALKRRIEDGEYDLVIMGTNGADDLEQFYFGTHTYRVIRKTTRPLLMVPEGCSFSPPKHIAYATDYDHCDVSTIRNLMALTEVFDDPHITVLHVSEKPTGISEEVYRCLRDLMEDGLDHPRVHFQRAVDKDAAAGIDAFMKKGGHDLVAVLTDRHSILERIFRESVTKELSYLADYPVLVLHHPEDGKA